MNGSDENNKGGELLISRVVDGVAQEHDWAEFRRLADQDPSLWRELAETQHNHTELTALVQAVMGGIALAIVDIPFAGLLSALLFMLCIAQLGPTPVLVPALIWVFYSGQIGWGIFLAVATLVITLLDNVLRPALIRMGADLPLLLIFAGVIGGLLAFGLVGIFVGPVVLAVGYMLLESWMDEVPHDP